MMLTYASFNDGRLVENGYITDCKVDSEIGSGTNNDTEITIYNTTNLLNVGDFIIDNEIGGVIDGYEIDTLDNSVVYHVLTWRGILSKKIITLDIGVDYQVLYKSDFISIINSMCGGFIKAKSDDIIFPKTLETRYSSLLDVFNMVDEIMENGAILQFNYDYNDGVIYVSNNMTSATSSVIEIDNDTNFSMRVKKQYDYNHIIGLGSGQLSNRERLEFYYNDDGTITPNPKSYIKDLKTYVYDYPNVESFQELEKATKKKLEEIAVIKELDINVISGNYLINEVLHVREYKTNFDAFIKVSQKIYTGSIEQGISKIKIDYKVGD